MTITKEIWLKATAEAMGNDACKELFQNHSNLEDLFTDYSFHLFQILSGKTVNCDKFIEVVVDFSNEIISEVTLNTTSILVNIALMCFANQIWDNMEKLTESEQINSEYEKFKSVLKSQKSE